MSKIYHLSDKYDPMSKVAIRLYTDFDGCICALPPYPEALHIADDKDLFKLDGSGPCNIRYSTELVKRLSGMLERLSIEWNWLTSNQNCTDWIDSVIGINHANTRTIEYIDSKTLKARKGGKAAALYDDLERIRNKSSRVVWIDDDFARPQYCRRLKKLVADMNIRMVAIRPNEHTGLNRSELDEIINLIYNPLDYKPGVIKFVDWTKE